MLRDECASALVKLQRGEGLTVGGPVWAVHVANSGQE